MAEDKHRIAIINVTGYAGAELARLLAGHPGVQLTSVTGRSEAGKKINEVFPHLCDMDLPIEDELGEADLVFSALPHKASAEALVPLVKAGTKVIDISADFRLKNPHAYEDWYDFTHPAPELLPEAVYGLPELHRSEIAAAKLVANPGCYPTSAILALAPAVQEGLIEKDIIVDSKSGVSGAGRALSRATHFPDVNDNLSAYALGGHRHLPEMVQELEGLCPGLQIAMTFLPHLTPMSRGILTSCYAKLAQGRLPGGEKDREAVTEVYRSFYAKEPFVRVTDSPPQTKHTQGTNFCFVYPTVDLRTGRLVVISCLDNLVKGAAGQALQDMNLMLGLPEITGIEGFAVYP
jgi:N-acetyl-gamma-glutamyl-phosphate reductase